MEPMKPMQPMEPMASAPKWWPDDLGEPSASGAQNDLHFAFFPNKERLAVKQGNQVSVFDAGDHEISGVTDGGAALVFRSQKGEFSLSELPEVRD